LIETHRWVWEGARWNALVLTLLAQICGASEQELRTLVEHLSDLDLLRVDALAGLIKGRKEPDREQTLSRRVENLLTSGGLNPDEAKVGLAVICEAAAGLLVHHEGKIQLYIRRYGEQMLREISQSFAFSSLESTKVGAAFTLWLQNVCDMPLCLVDDHLSSFATKNGLEVKELIAAADELDLNLGLLDELALSEQQQKLPLQ